MQYFKPYLEKVKNQSGFIAALDQSGGSTPKALDDYGINQDSYTSDQEMFDLVHQMRTRIIKSPAFNGDRILGAILFEDTMEKEIDHIPTAQYLWENKKIVPFLKVDKGLAKLDQGVQLMKDIPDLETLLEKAQEKQIFGTKMRSVIKLANPQGIAAIIAQQFEVGMRILESGLYPIIEPEIDIHSPEKQEAENLLKQEILKYIAQLQDNQKVILKLTLPEQANYYTELIEHPNVLKVVALSGGYSQKEANTRLSQNTKMIASFSRALTKGLNVQQSDSEFNQVLESSIESIFQASIT